jgi:chaperone required for assembly of F1-ATPase
MSDAPSDPGSKDPRKTDPYALARKQAEAERLKRFYKAVSVASVDGGFEVRLDGRPLRSPAKQPVQVPTHPVADALANEWETQTTYIEPGTMPLTRLVNTALDGVARERDAVAAEMARFILTDLVCYRAEHPETLIQRQADVWDPAIAHVMSLLGVRLHSTAGIMVVEQDPRAADAMMQRLSGLHTLALTGAASIITLTGSAALLLCLLEHALDADAVWHAAHMDEDWNIERWGQDEEATARRALRRAEFDASVLLLGV